MDEATSALDNATEHSVIKTINALEGDRTIIMFCNTVKLGFKAMKLGLRCLLQGDIQPKPLRQRGRLCQIADFSETALRRVYQYRQNVLGDYLANKAARDAAAPIICYEFQE